MGESWRGARGESEPESRIPRTALRHAESAPTRCFNRLLVLFSEGPVAVWVRVDLSYRSARPETQPRFDLMLARRTRVFTSSHGSSCASLFLVPGIFCLSSRRGSRASGFVVAVPLAGCFRAMGKVGVDCQKVMDPSILLCGVGNFIFFNVSYNKETACPSCPQST